ncbi:DHH family phosphoesterase [Robiginitalea marina]|uniref:Bifunctional oligoribonuclease/PAP phosphatase NrnA n=1 Tax=Robiginitalea marina TaxID=2954105 RepID=A0ABT1B221_9FLAO|nr:bifunctional oligoribonuclease/PAP phosphatase NrnA [Robiginitalea marina]MCO5725458.1 bifunctional oligoribonuclease/PAP phosphatase NrnA [Robiginitalea marina]
MNPTAIHSLKELLRLPKRVLLVPHKNPDGDAMGACLGLCHLLRAQNHAVTVISPNEFPDFLKWMPGADAVVVYEKQEAMAKGLIGSAEVVFTLDFNTLERIGPMAEPLRAAAPPFVMIDHHQSPDGYAQVTLSDPDMSSTCEMVYHVIRALGLGDSITPSVASCLYTGILTDTGSFKYAAATPVTLRVAAELMERGAPHTDIHRNIYDTNRPERLQLLGCALQNLVILKEFRTAYITLSQDELDRHRFHKGDTEGFVNYGLSLKDVVLAAIFIENRDEGIIKISFRSQGDFSVNNMARAHFEGGGHINAAGGRSSESLGDTVERFVGILPQYQKALME